MLFTLEALDARHGDALLLHYGFENDPKLIVVDGGPRGVYRETLRPRLDALRETRTPDGALPIRLLMVSHIDEDHVVGIMELTAHMLRAREDNEPAPYIVSTLWHNSFDDVVSRVALAHENADPVLRAASTDAPPSPSVAMAADTRLVLASVGQGRELRNNAAKLALLVNPGFNDLVVADATRAMKRAMGGGLSFTVIGPRQDQVDALQREWDEHIAAQRAAGKLEPASMEAIAADFVDKSVFNLSSIVVLAQLGRLRMLLTGDARGDFIVQGLAAAGLLRNGSIHLDLLKMPHHGSARDVAVSFFTAVTARHYVFSANGKFDNPDVETLELLFTARPRQRYTLHFTNRVPSVEQFLSARKPKGVKAVFRDDRAPSVKIDLGAVFSG